LTNVVYFERMAPDGLESQVAVNTEQLRHLANELGRTRERLHELESDRATLRLVVQQVRELTEQMPNLARRAAREAVDEFLRRRHADTLSNWRTYAALLSAGVAFGALIVGLVLR
jgi:chromosome segregation ATPase